MRHGCSEVLWPIPPASPLIAIVRELHLMPTLVLPPRYTPDSIALGGAAATAGWEVERLASWRVPDWLVGRDVVLYGEPLFAAVVAEPLGIALIEPTFGWLPSMALEYRQREVRQATLSSARLM